MMMMMIWWYDDNDEAPDEWIGYVVVGSMLSPVSIVVERSLVWVMGHCCFSTLQYDSSFACITHASRTHSRRIRRIRLLNDSRIPHSCGLVSCHKSSFDHNMIMWIVGRIQTARKKVGTFRALQQLIIIMRENSSFSFARWRSPSVRTGTSCSGRMFV